jgi:2-methylisocitrate lyase-like PEP mutase family enzyme
MKAPGSKLRQLLHDGLVVTPACYDALSARLIEANGFKAVIISGLGVSLSHAARADLDLLTLTELVSVAARIAEAVDVPVVMDAEHGFGGVLMVERTVREFERAGLAAIHIEDSGQKKGLEKLGLVSVSEMVAKIKAARSARWDPDFMIIARTDASIVSADEMVARGNAYLEAGADVVWTAMHGAGILKRPAEAKVAYERMPKEIHGTLMTNSIYGTDFTIDDARRLGYHWVSLPSPAIASAARAVDECLKALAAGKPGDYFSKHPPYSLGDLSKLCHQDEFLERESSYYRS